MNGGRTRNVACGGRACIRDVAPFPDLKHTSPLGINFALLHQKSAFLRAHQEKTVAVFSCGRDIYDDLARPPPGFTQREKFLSSCITAATNSSFSCRRSLPSEPLRTTPSTAALPSPLQRTTRESGETWFYEGRSLIYFRHSCLQFQCVSAAKNNPESFRITPPKVVLITQAERKVVGRHRQAWL